MLPIGEHTLAHYLAGAGYDTAYVGKWHLASAPPHRGPDDFETHAIPPERRGGYRDFWLASDVLEFTSHSYDGHMFDARMRRRNFPSGRYRADVLTDWAIEYLLKRSTDRPFFLFVSYIEPHHQNDHKHFEGPRGSRRRFREFVVPGDLTDTTGDWRTEYPDYLGCINRVDENVGRFREALRDLGQNSNTVVFYTSDHGSHFRTRNSEYKRSCHDGCIRIPMIAAGPGFEGGLVVPQLVSLIDLPPTVLRCASVKPPRKMRGRCLQPLVAGRTSGWRNEVFLQISESQCGRAIRTNRWKYSVRAPDKTGADPSSDTYVEDYLYDLTTDPHERANLVADRAHAATRKRLARILKEHMRKAGEKVPTVLQFLPYSAVDPARRRSL